MLFEEIEKNVRIESRVRKFLRGKDGNEDEEMVKIGIVSRK